MGRPSVLTDEVRSAIERHRGDGVTLEALRSRLAADGFEVSRATLARHLSAARPKPPPGAVPTVGALERGAGAAVAGGELAALYQARDEVAGGLARLAPKLGRDHRAVRSYARLVEIQAKISRAIVECTPRPPEERYKPIEGEALAALLTRAQAAVADDETGALRQQVVDQADAIRRLTQALGGVDP